LTTGRSDAGASAPGTLVVPLETLADGEVTEHPYDRTSSMLLVRRGAKVCAWRNLCPHQWLPLNYRSEKIVSADGQRLRCSNHGAVFSTEDGSPVGDAFVSCGLEPVPVQVDGEGRVVIDARA
jgi:nitrite reductase/ring-hydroxylating ferredoxin subunit